MKLFNLVFTTCLLAMIVILPAQSSYAQRSPKFDQNAYYRLTTKLQGKTKALDVTNDGEDNRVTIAKVNDYAHQYWRITPLGDGYFSLTTRSQGAGKSLSVINEGKNTQVQLSKTGNNSGQAWLIESIGGGYYRLTSEWQGPKKALGIIKGREANKVELSKTNKYAGQYWSITEIAGSRDLTAGATGRALSAGQIMKRGSKLTSPRRRYSLQFQTDGNLGFYGPSGSYIWDAETAGKGETCILQTDGNLVIYDRADRPVWSSETMGYFDRKYALKEWKPVRLDVSDSGILALRSITKKVVWSRTKENAISTITRLDAGQTLKRGSSITSPNKRYTLNFQPDGNLAFYGPDDKYIWDAQTTGKGESCILQADGNLVIYDKEKAPVWSSETMSYFDRKFASREWKPVKLEISNSGICALRSVMNRTAWSIGGTRVEQEDNGIEGAGSVNPSAGFLYMLKAGQSLGKGTGVASPRGIYSLRFQTDGNLAFYGPNNKYIWDAKTSGQGEKCAMERDGNLVIYNRSNQVVWSSKTTAYFDRKFDLQDWKPVKLEISDIGLCALKSATNNVAWVCGEDPSFGLRRTLKSGQSLGRGTGITSADRSYTLKFLRDGNLAFHGPNDSYIWDAKTTGRGDRCVLQSDGNLVIFDRNSQVIWSSKTMAYFDRKFGQTEWKPVKLEVSDSGVCALLSATNRVAWSVGIRR